jgi:hypothetical protein
MRSKKKYSNVNAALRLYFPSIIFNDVIFRLTPLRTSCSSETNLQGGLMGNGSEVAERRSRGDSRELV